MIDDHVGNNAARRAISPTRPSGPLPFPTYRVFCTAGCLPARFHEQPNQSWPLDKEIGSMRVLGVRQATAREPQGGATGCAKTLYLLQLDMNTKLLPAYS